MSQLVIFYDTEVQWENIALNKPAYSSSVYASIEAGPSKAVDGNTDLNVYAGSCFHSRLRAMVAGGLGATSHDFLGQTHQQRRLLL